MRSSAPIDVIVVPYDSGRRNWRMGAGPAALLERGLADTLREWGHETRVIDLALRDGGPIELLAATIDLLRTTSQHVRAARNAGRFPLVLTGNCITTVGAVAGLDGTDVAVAWLDAHGDLNTPATSTSGFLDGMAAATLLGWCHNDETATLQGFRPVPPLRFLLVGARDLDPAELRAMERANVRALRPQSAASEPTLERALDDLLVAAEGAWLHIDFDVFDPASVAWANPMTPPGGLTLYQTIRVVQEVAARGRLLGLTLSSYDPSMDPDGMVYAAAIPLISEALTMDVAAE